jgi:PST family polysaccharide transporter
MKLLTSDNRRLFDNFISLFVLQGANYLLPLLTVPYLVRILGPEKYGLIAFAQAFIQYFIIVTDYGFNLSATRKIAIAREDSEKLSQIVNTVMFIKAILALICFLALLGCIYTFDKFQSDSLLYIYTFGMVIGNLCFPVWFFQGIEKMRYISFLNIFAKIIFTLSIFIFVKQQDDFLLIPIINSLGYITAGIISLYMIVNKFNIKIQKVSNKMVTEEIKDGWHIFLSTAAISLYTASNTFILGLLTNNTIVGYYSAGEKAVKAVQGVIGPISQAVYPHINKLVTESPVCALKFIKKVLLILGAVGFILSLFLALFADIIVGVLLGNQYANSVNVIKILAFLPFIIALSNVFGIQTMLIFKLNKAFSNIIVTAGLLNISVTFLLIPLYQHTGTAITVVMTETFVTITMFIYLRIKGINVVSGTFDRKFTGLK